MRKTGPKKTIQELFDLAGISINGANPFDIQVYNDDFYEFVLRKNALALGESYMERWWDCHALDQFFDRLLRINLNNILKHSLNLLLHNLKTKFLNLQNLGRSFQVGQEHYDIGNDLYQKMLDKRMVYTCGYWKTEDTLEGSQEAKLDLICKKIGLAPGMTVLDLGCGFGSFGKYAAEKYGANVMGVTVSKEQARLGQELCKGLPVEISLQDYRNVQGRFDRVISIGIMEHVGYKNYATYMKKVHALLKDDGIAFIHTIGRNFSTTSGNQWTTKYIFPNGMLPSISQIGRAMEGRFVMEDWHNFGPDYYKTLMAWNENFEKAWPTLKNKYGERFYRMWRYYLLSSAGGFMSRQLQLWQIVMTKIGREQPDCRIS